MAAVGSVRPQPQAASTTSTAAACTPPTRRWRCQLARDVYTRRQEGISVWVVRSDQIVASDPADKAEMFDPMEDKVYRHPTFYELPAKWTTCGRFRLAVASSRYATCCASATPPDPRAAPRRMDAATRPILEEDIALSNMALDLVGQARALLTHAGAPRGHGPRRGPARLPARRARLPQPHAGRAAARRLRDAPSCATSCSRACQRLLWEALASSSDAELAAIAGKASRKRAITCATRPTGSCAWATAPTESHARVAVGARCAVAVHRRVLHRGRRRQRRGARPASARPGPTCKPAWEAAVRRCSRSRPCDPGARRRSARPASSACTASTWATCWPRCSICSAPTRARSGERERRAMLTERRPGRCCSRCSIRRCRRSRCATSASCATCAPATRREGRRHADVLRLPRDGSDRERDSRSARGRGAQPASRSRRDAPAWTTDWITARPAQAARVRHRAASAGRERADAAAALRRPAPPARAASAHHHPAVGIRLDRLQGAVPLRGLPRAVRILQTDLRAVVRDS